jgi:hypothetical protein
MAINIYEPMRFSSQGIDDLATQPSLTVTNGRITVDTIEPKKEIIFAANNLSEVEGKGIKWSDGRKTKNFIFKNGMIGSDLSINLSEDKDFQINDTSVLNFTELGNTVTKSNLKQLGTLKNLRVSGSAELGDFVFVNSDLNRVGINTESPRSALTIKENNVEFGIGSLKNKTASIGTFTNDAVEIFADSVPRITISTNGEIKIHGKLIVDDLVTERTPWMLFKETKDSTNYGKGIIWAPLSGISKQLCLQAGPDRIHSTEIFDLAKDKFYSIENISVLSLTKLGQTVTDSNLTSVGVLRELQVGGNAAIAKTLSTSELDVGRMSLSNNLIKVRDTFNITRDENIDFTISSNITIGNPNNTSRAVTVYGNLAVGVTNPDPDVSLTVNGPVVLDNKKFLVSSRAPISGQFNKGDIVWNNDPKATDYIGWVCVASGTPGAWLPFGVIARQ